MNEVMEVQSLEDVCRLCLSTDEAKSSIFGVPNSTISLADKIQACLSIQVSTNDRLSTLICTNCVKNVNTWHAYKESCLRSQEKLQQWLVKQLPCNPTVLHIKEEPVDIDDPINDNEIEPEHNGQPDLVDVNNVAVLNNASAQSEDNLIDKQIASEGVPQKPVKQKEASPVRENNVVDKQILNIKSELIDDFSETDSLMDVSSASDGELLLNPMAMAKVKEDRIVEADSTQKFKGVSMKNIKKLRRGPRTHFKGKKISLYKCVYCKINLHSKYSYTHHMKKYHGSANNVLESTKAKDKFKSSSPSHIMSKKKTPQVKFVTSPGRTSAHSSNEALAEPSTEDEEEEMIEDVEDELASLENAAPLTPVQQNIISQLKTFTCYSCQQYFFDRRSTLNHIRQHLPDLRPYTCIACLTEFGDRAMYKMHCSESFECAMKIALVVPKYGTEKYFTCNMCLRPMPNRAELLSHLSKHSDKQYEQLTSPNTAKSPPKLTPMLSEVTETSVADDPGPYENGDPKYNHKCDLCGMVYKRKPNMYKHRELCATLQPEVRTSYKCVHCRMTFLVFKKFQSHMVCDHKKKEYTCHICGVVNHTPDEYLEHHNAHRGYAPVASNTSDIDDESSTPKYNCALCGEKFNNHADLSEHRNLHLKVKIYSCVICRSMFSSPGSLEIHMKDHGIEETNEEHSVNSSCEDYSEDQSMENDSTVPGNAQCPECGKCFSNVQNVKRHIKLVHRVKFFHCTICSVFFKKKDLLDYHYKTQHPSEQQPTLKAKKPILQCPRCSKTFTYHGSMNQHCLKEHGIPWKPESVFECDLCDRTFQEESSLNVHRGWHKRQPKSPGSQATTFQDSNANAMSTSKPAKARKSFPNPPPSIQNIQCQVCDDNFSDVTELRKHVWQIHCAHSKQEKPFTENELQCELCTNVFPDRESLDNHMAWHRDNPILSAPKKSFRCDLCGKSYSTRKILYKHKKLHKMMPTAQNRSQLVQKKSQTCNICNKVFSSIYNCNKHKVMVHPGYQSQPKSKKEIAVNASETTKKKPVTCLLCKAVFPSMRVLYQHKQLMHNTHNTRPKMTLMPLKGHEGSVCCNICGKQFPGVTNLKHHFTLKHKHGERYNCTLKNCNQQFASPQALKQHENEVHLNILYSCNLCERHYFNRGIMIKHMNNTHKAVYQPGTNKNAYFTETDLIAYEVKGLVNVRECPRCKIMYPNNKALKIHFFKYHDRGL